MRKTEKESEQESEKKERGPPFLMVVFSLGYSFLYGGFLFINKISISIDKAKSKKAEFRCLGQHNF